MKRREGIKVLIQDLPSPLAASHRLCYLICMSAVELAVRKVKELSARQARELLHWLSAQRANGTSLKEQPRKLRRENGPRVSMRKLKAWQDSIRFTTDWEPPRMPDDLVQPSRL